MNIIGSGRLKEKKEIETIDLKEVGAFFEKGGILPTNLKGYESRREQVEMTKAVAQAFNEDQYLIAEAGTGTGKSLAYLIPSILWAYQNGQRVILSTNTKNLQDQLFYKDLPFLQRIMNKEFRVTLLKGRSNYLCLERWREVMRNPDLYLSTEDRIAILPLVLWIEETLTGDISENRGFHPDRNRGLWAKLTCPEREEKDAHKRCFLNRARDKAQKSHLVVVNHSLLLSDLATENRVLSSYSRLVLDEAHNLEKIATEHLGIEVNFYGLKRILDRLQEKGRRGLLSKFQSRIERGRFPRPTKESLLHQMETLNQIIPESQERGMTLFQKVSSLLSSKKQRYRPGDEFLQSISEEGKDILYTLTRLKSGLVSLGEELRDLKFSQTRIGTETLQDLEEVSQDLLHFINALNVLLLDLREDYCYWAEARRDPLRTELHSVPIDVGTLLSEDLYKKMDSILFTSATLTVASSFDFFSNRTGISLLDPDRVTQISLGSSFSFDEQVRVLIPHYLPLPKSANFPKRIGETIQKVILSTKRGTMILTTSYDLLKFLDEQLRGELEENGIELLVQRRSGSRMGILEIFKEEKNSCLLGTDSFWEGVDVPGDALELLIMTKLPFPVPNEPIIEARCEALEKEGLDSFSNFMIPMAVIRLRQGFGRLIRTREDRGVVLLLDNRVSRQQYGEFFLNSLPVEPIICGSEEEIMKILLEFWR
ncbi:DEAD/DEAH box helicase family protein [candidate division TA06 bacterium]|nr:DEAD/DEAH box helicase family protein [candidate division TA06 bacterium]